MVSVSGTPLVAFSRPARPPAAESPRHQRHLPRNTEGCCACLGLTNHSPSTSGPAEGFLDDLAERVADRVAVRLEPQATSPWMCAANATSYLDTSEDAIRSLVTRNKIPHHRSADTGRLMFYRAELDAWARGEAR
jgi:hypothetical protein